MKVSVIAVVFLVAVYFGPVQPSSAAAKLPIQIYYESLCPDSVRFIQNQLYPSYEAIKDYVDILYIPFGKSESTVNKDKTVSFDCQHGPAECDGNRIQSCVLNQLANEPDAQAEFVACQMKRSADPSGAECAAAVNVSEEAISECFDGPVGTQLQLEAEQLTKVIRPAFVPTIVFNWRFSQKYQDRSLRNFLSVVCKHLGNAAPACQGK